MNLTDIRRARLREWLANRTAPAKEKSYFSQLLNGRASFGEKAARRIEQDYLMAPGSLDDPRIDISAARNCLIAQITARLADLPSEKPKALAIMIDAAE